MTLHLTTRLAGYGTLGLLLGCSTSVCKVGVTRDCVGPGACRGAQSCDGDGMGWGACVCEGAGGASDAGPSASGGAGGTASTAQNMPADCTAPIAIPDGALNVDSTGRLMLGELQGAVHSEAWFTAAPSTPPCIKVTHNRSALCAVGNVEAADTTQRVGVEVGVRLDGGSDFDAAAGGIPVLDSITVTTHLEGTKLGNSQLRLSISANDQDYCVLPNQWASGVPVPIGKFSTGCSTGTGTFAPAGLAVTSIDVEILASQESALPFAFCITDISVQ